MTEQDLAVGAVLREHGLTAVLTSLRDAFLDQSDGLALVVRAGLEQTLADRVARLGPRRVVVVAIHGLRRHPNRTDLAVGIAAGRQVVVGRECSEGRLGLFIPASMVVPLTLLGDMGLWNWKTKKGRLAGRRGDRVKSREIAGVLSEGLFHYGEIDCRWREGEDVTDAVGCVHAGGN